MPIQKVSKSLKRSLPFKETKDSQFPYKSIQLLRLLNLIRHKPQEMFRKLQQLNVENRTGDTSLIDFIFLTAKRNCRPHPQSRYIDLKKHGIVEPCYEDKVFERHNEGEVKESEFFVAHILASLRSS